MLVVEHFPSTQETLGLITGPPLSPPKKRKKEKDYSPAFKKHGAAVRCEHGRLPRQEAEWKGGTWRESVLSSPSYNLEALEPFCGDHSSPHDHKRQKVREASCALS